MGTEMAVVREKLTKWDLQILDHLEQAQSLDAALTESSNARAFPKPRSPSTSKTSFPGISHSLTPSSNKLVVAILVCRLTHYVRRVAESGHNGHYQR